jgi:hypothetical protein
MLEAKEHFRMPRFTKGDPAGPGRPTGRRNKITEFLDELAGDGTVKLLSVVRDRAQQGDMRAASIVLARTWPRKRGRAVPLDLPPVETSAGLIQAQAALVAAMARGEVTPLEAASIASVLETQRRAIEMHEHEQLIRELEEKKAEPAPHWETGP